MEGHIRAFAAANPVGLHDAHGFRPINVSKFQQFIGILRNLEEPLRHHLLDDGLPGALIHAINDLFIRQHRLQSRRPVHQRLTLIGQVILVELLEEPLRPAIVNGIATHGLAFPVEHRAHAT